MHVVTFRSRRGGDRHRGFHGIFRTRAWRAPAAAWRECHIAGSKHGERSIRRSYASTCPHGTTLRVDHAKHRDGAAIVHVEAGPVPAGGTWIDVVRRPLPVQPRFTAYRFAALPAREFSRDRQVRNAEISTRRVVAPPLAAIATIALENRRLGRREPQVERECVRPRPRGEAAVNIWPRTYQQPHPPVWITGST